ncbi:MAG: hypothetical protein WBE48_13535 [Xanthobacteraceae bacterium]
MVRIVNRKAKVMLVPLNHPRALTTRLCFRSGLSIGASCCPSQSHQRVDQFMMLRAKIGSASLKQIRGAGRDQRIGYVAIE